MNRAVSLPIPCSCFDVLVDITTSRSDGFITVKCKKKHIDWSDSANCVDFLFFGDFLFDADDVFYYENYIHCDSCPPYPALVTRFAITLNPHLPYFS